MEVSDEFIEKYSWMVRPCYLYKEEYSDCTSIRSRFHQHFVHGKFSDCGPWNRDYKNCYEWTENNNKKALKELVEHELARRKERLKAHLENDVWEKRSEPPAGWNDPLPEHIEKRIENSYLAVKAQELKEGASYTESSFCVIS